MALEPLLPAVETLVVAASREALSTQCRQLLDGAGRALGSVPLEFSWAHLGNFAAAVASAALPTLVRLDEPAAASELETRRRFSAALCRSKTELIREYGCVCAAVATGAAFR